MSFIEKIKERARNEIKTIVLPEAEDRRVLEAATKITKQGFAKIILIGNETEIVSKAKENNINIEGATIIDPLTSDKK